MESLNDSDRLTEINKNSAQNNEVIKVWKSLIEYGTYKIYIHIHGERERESSFWVSEEKGLQIEERHKSSDLKG